MGSFSKFSIFRKFAFVFVSGFTVFAFVFVFKYKSRKWLRSFPTVSDRFHPYCDQWPSRHSPRPFAIRLTETIQLREPLSMPYAILTFTRTASIFKVGRSKDYLLRICTLDRKWRFFFLWERSCAFCFLQKWSWYFLFTCCESGSRVLLFLLTED
jgi:hypothetical protein